MGTTLKFGVPGKVVDIPAPLVGMQFTNGRDITEAKLSSGGRSVYAAPTTYKTFNMNWTAYDTSLRLLLDMYRGNWGTQAFWMQDPTADPTNVLPARWGSAWQLSAVANGWCLPTVASTSKGPQDLQVTFKQGTLSTRSRTKGVLKARVLRLPGEPYYFSCDFDSTGGAGIIVRGYDSTQNKWVDFATYATSQSNTVVVPASVTTYTFIECDVYMPANSTLALRHVVLGYAPRWTSLRKNLATNPSFETASGTVNVRTQLVENPLCSSGWGSRWAGGGTASATYTYPTGATAVAANGSYVHKTWTAGGGSTNGDTGFDNSNNTSLYAAVTPGQIISFSAYLRPSVGDKVGQASLQFLASDKSTSVGSRYYGANTSMAANVWTRISQANVTVPSGAAYVMLIPDVGASGALWNTGDTLDLCGPLLEVSPIVGTYFDGSTAASGDYTYVWSGTANASTSYQQAPGVAGWISGGATPKQIRSTEQKSDRSYALKAYWPNASYDTTAVRFQLGSSAAPQGSTWTASADIYVPAGNPGVRIYMGDYSTFAQAATTTTTGSWVRVSVTFTVTSASGLYLDFRPGTATAGSEVCYVDKVLLEQASTLGTYFDGSTAADTADDIYYLWDGTADASTSEQVKSNVPGLSITDFPSGTGVGAVQFIQNMQGTFKKTGWYGMAVDIEEIENGEGLSAIA